MSLILTQSYANSIWANHAGFVQSAATLKREKLESSEEIRNIRRDLRRLFRGLNVLNVTLLDMSGLVVYSTNTNQIGIHFSDNAQFRRARNGEAISMHALHDTYETDRGELSGRHIVTSYVPIRILDAAPVEGIITIDVDTTH